jgi:hypothetical protein
MFLSQVRDITYCAVCVLQICCRCTKRITILHPQMCPYFSIRCTWRHTTDNVNPWTIADRLMLIATPVHIHSADSSIQGCPVTRMETFQQYTVYWRYPDINPLTPNDHYSGRTAPLTSKRCILYIYSTNIGTEYFKHGIYSPYFSLQNAVCFIIPTYLVLVLFSFYTLIQQI